MFHLINFWQSKIKNFMDLPVIKTSLNIMGLGEGFLSPRVCHPHLVEAVLLFDTVFLVIAWLIFLSDFLYHISSLTEGDLSGVSQYEESDCLFEQTLVRHKWIVRLYSLQVLFGEQLLNMVFGIILVTWLVFVVRRKIREQTLLTD